MKHKVLFLPSNISVEAEDSTTISSVALENGIRIQMPCGGKGRCRRCKVSVDGKEELACLYKIEKDIVVEIPDKNKKIIALDDKRKLNISDLNPLSNGLSLAVDIGTTTIAVCILDSDNGLELYTASGENKQRSIGYDVLSRIQYASEGGTEDMRHLVINSINELIETFICDGKINSICISGNTVMEHIFAGVDPTPIRTPPYLPVVEKYTLSGEESGLKVHSNAILHSMPCVSAYVGGDIASDIVYSNMDISDEMCLLIDVGTNGEVAVGNKDMILVCSSSAGPAFEGGNLKDGMAASIGAIESVTIDGNTISYDVIGGTEPEGICGSGIIELLAQLFINGIIDKRGNLQKHPSVKNKKFFITGEIGISEDEIKDVIMTKAAIYSASKSLIRNLGLQFSDLKKIYIAGGFGYHIDLKSAITIGMFPDLDENKYEYIGNASLGGAKSYLLSKSFRERVDISFSKTTYLDLSSDAVFFDEYTSAQFLPHTDVSQFPSVINTNDA